MKGIDTNVLVRYLVQDNPVQSREATHFLEKECSVEEPVFINGIVLCELVWVLETAYEYSRQIVAPIIDKILRTKQFNIDKPDIVLKSLQGYQHDGADFADHYIANLNGKKGCEFTYTFDKKASQLNHFKLLGSGSRRK